MTATTTDTLAEVARTHKAYERATAALLRAREARAVAAYQAHEAGASYATLAAALGMSRPNVVPLVRLGAEAVARGNEVCR